MEAGPWGCAEGAQTCHHSRGQSAHCHGWDGPGGLRVKPGDGWRVRSQHEGWPEQSVEVGAWAGVEDSARLGLRKDRL